MRGFRPFLVLTAALVLAACGGRTSGLVKDTGPVEKKGDADPQVAQGDELWQARADRAKAEAAVKSWEEAAALDPTRADIQLKLAYAYYFLANAHARWDADGEDRQLGLYEKGLVAGENAIKLAVPAFAKKIRDGAGWAEAVKEVGPEGVPALYWYATNLGKWALLDGFTTILSHKDDVAAIMKRVLEVDPGFFHGAPHRYFGVYRTKIPFPGGDLPASRKHFEDAVKLAPNYVDTKVLFAEAYAVKAQDEALFEKLLNEVINTPDDVLPELVPETKNAKRVAKELLDNRGDFF